MGGHHHHHRLRIDRQHLGQPRQALAAVVGAGAEIHVQQQHIEDMPAGQRRQLAGVVQGLHGGEMALQQQPGGMEDVFIIIHHQDAGVAGRGRFGHVFASGQVSGFVYASGQAASADVLLSMLKSNGLILACPLRYKVHDYATITFRLQTHAGPGQQACPANLGQRPWRHGPCHRQKAALAPLRHLRRGWRSWSCGVGVLGAAGRGRQCLSRAGQPADHRHGQPGPVRGLHRGARRGGALHHRLSHHRPGRHGQTGAGRGRRDGQKRPAADHPVQPGAAAAGRRPAAHLRADPLQV